MRAGLSFSRSSISLLLRQPLSIKKSHAGAIQVILVLFSNFEAKCAKKAQKNGKPFFANMS
jgi:hypothetical protein